LKNSHKDFSNVNNFNGEKMKQLFTTSFIVLALTLAGVAAEATPKVGDKAVYGVTLSNGSQTANGHMTMEITAYDAGTDSWTIVNTTELNGNTQSQTAHQKSADMVNDALIDSMLANCEANGGKNDSVVSPAGTFPSCALPNNDGSSSGTVWVSKVPFGFSKWTSTRSDGMSVNGLIESFVAAAVK
jgi:hypothetical protein